MKKLHINIILKKKKNILAAWFCIGMMLFCCGCGKKDNVNQSTEEPGTQEQPASGEENNSENPGGSTQTADSENSYYVTLSSPNQWDSGDGSIGAQCDIVLYNNTSEDISDWKLEINVSDGFRVESLWNGSYEIKGNKLIITAAEYNQTVMAESNIPIGFIMYGKAVPEETEVVLTVNGSEVARQTDSKPQDTGNGTEEIKDTTQAPSEQDNADKLPAGENALEKYGRLSVKGTKLVDENGKTVQLTGVSTHGLSWFPEYVNKGAFQSLRDTWGVNIIRLAMYSDENMGYCTGGDKEKLKSLIDQAVRDTFDLGMYVIIDWHVLGDATPKKHQAEAEKFFEEMSAKYASFDNVLYEICNEPNSGTSWADVKSYAESVIPIIRKNHKDAVIIVGTPTWCQDVDVVAKDPITGYDNLLYAVHFYAATHKDDLRKKTETALDAGLPLIISEFSICDASGNGGIDYDSAAAWMKLADKYQLSFIGWSLCNKAETASLISSGCSKISDFKEEDLSETGKWLMEEIRKR